MSEIVRTVHYRVLGADDRLVYTLVVADGLNILPWYRVTANRQIVLAPDAVYSPPWRVEAQRSGDSTWTVLDRSAEADQENGVPHSPA